MLRSLAFIYALRQLEDRFCPFESLLPNPRYARVGEEGFEPPYDRTKTCCLTAWRLPNLHPPFRLEYSTAPFRQGSGQIL